MSSKILRGVGISTYNRGDNIEDIVEAVLETKPDDAVLVVADDGSSDGTFSTLRDANLPVVYIRGQNKGVVANKNRILTALQGCTFIAMMEDDLKPVEKGWFEDYEKAAIHSGLHHFCRIQDKEVPSESPDFDSFLTTVAGTPIYSDSVRGDFVFLTNTVVRTVGGLNPSFRGVGYGHLEWAERISKAGLIPHPKYQWVDIREARDKFIQVGDTEGGRWDKPEEEINKQLESNRAVLRSLRKEKYTHCPLVLE